MKPLGLYIHIPFCRSKCAYCDFYSLAGNEEKMDAYTAAVIRHLEEVAPRTAGQSVDSVYFGGGTPSYLGSGRLVKILKAVQKRYTLTRDAEITWEANPDSVGDWKTLRTLRRAGFNRLSLGVQSTDDEILRRIGRVHTYAQVIDAMAAAQMAKLENLSVDLIYGLPGQTMEQWKETVITAASLPVQHISCYGLKVEEGTPLWRQRETARLPDDDLQADMYLWAAEALERNGFAQYEISNFARPGFESRHNLKYWQMLPYAGFGPGAHSDFGDVRFAYEKELDAYIAGNLRLSEREEIDPRERCLEYIMLSLRTVQGIDRRYFETTYRLPFETLDALFATYETHHLAVRTENGWHLTPKGFLVSNRIIGAVQELVAQERVRRQQAAMKRDYRMQP